MRDSLPAARRQRLEARITTLAGMAATEVDPARRGRLEADLRRTLADLHPGHDEPAPGAVGLSRFAANPR